MVSDEIKLYEDNEYPDSFFIIKMFNCIKLEAPYIFKNQLPKAQLALLLLQIGKPNITKLVSKAMLVAASGLECMVWQGGGGVTMGGINKGM